jgi:hypothetical protein
MTGNMIATSSGGGAIIDLGSLGRIEVGNNTAITLICAGNTVQVNTNCRRTEVEVTRSQVAVGSETIAAGQEKEFEGKAEVVAVGGADFKVECEGRRAGGGFIAGRGLFGLLAVIGVGAAVATGLALRDEDMPAVVQPLSQAQP